MPSRNNARNNGQGGYRHGSPHNTGNTAPLQLGQGARNAATAHQPLTVYQPNNGTPPAPASAGGTVEPLAHNRGETGPS